MSKSHSIINTVNDEKVETKRERERERERETEREIIDMPKINNC